MPWSQIANIKGPTGANGATGATGAQGPPGVGFTWRGAWSNTTAYAINDTVSRNNQSYVCILANTGNDPATDSTHWNLIAAQGGAGPTGPAGSNASTTNTASFTIPPVGSTVPVTVADASWVVLGQMLVVATAGGSASASGTLQVTAKTGNQLTLLNPVAGAMPIASTTKPGMVNTLSGNASDYIGGDNACHPVIPAGVIWDFAGATAPTGWLFCDGTSYAQSAYPNLYTALGGASSPWGVSAPNFNVPDLRGKVIVGVGQGSGLTNRALGTTGGEETHALSVAELAVHAHTDSGHTHGMDHYHQVDFSQINHAHGVNDPTHTHSYTYVSSGGAFAAGSGYANSVGGATTGAKATGITIATASFGVGNSGYASSVGYGSTGSAAAAITNAGSGTGHNTMPPFAVCTKIIKT